MKPAAQNWGFYPNRPLRLRDLFPPDGRRFALEEDFVYEDKKGVAWLAPTDLLTDGATIPTVFWSVIGGPWDGLYREAAVVHDAYCCGQTAPWQDVHRMFYEAMRCSGVGWVQAKTMFYAVWLAGPRWSQLNTSMPAVCKTAAPATSPSRIARQWPKLLKPGVVDQLWQIIHSRQLTVAEARAVARPFFNRTAMSDADAIAFVEALRKTEVTQEEKDLITLSVILSQRFDENDVKQIEEWIRREDPSLEQIEVRAEDMRRSSRVVEPLIFSEIPTWGRSLDE